MLRLSRTVSKRGGEDSPTGVLRGAGEEKVRRRRAQGNMGGRVLIPEHGGPCTQTLAVGIPFACSGDIRVPRCSRSNIRLDSVLAVKKLIICMHEQGRNRGFVEVDRGLCMAWLSSTSDDPSLSATKTSPVIHQGNVTAFSNEMTRYFG